MKTKNLVLGANGHLGNNIIRQLMDSNQPVTGSLRNLYDSSSLNIPNIEIVHADLMDKNSLVRAMNGIDILYVTAAVYKSWAKNIQKEIIDVNITGSKNVIEAAAQQGVKKIIYTSTTFVLNDSGSLADKPSRESNNADPYTYSKIEAEKLAWRLAERYNLEMISVLPSGMVGPHCYNHLTPTMEVLDSILKNKIPIDPCFGFNLVDVRDVAAAMITAADKGKPGERYILAQPDPISSTEVFQLAHSLYPFVKIPKKAGYGMLIGIAVLSELISKINGKKPLMFRSQVRHMYKADFRFDISKSASELGFNPRPTGKALKEVFNYLLNERK